MPYFHAHDERKNALVAPIFASKFCGDEKLPHYANNIDSFARSKSFGRKFPSVLETQLIFHAIQRMFSMIVIMFIESEQGQNSAIYTGQYKSRLNFDAT